MSRASRDDIDDATAYLWHAGAAFDGANFSMEKTYLQHALVKVKDAIARSEIEEDMKRETVQP